MSLNASIPEFQALLREEFLYDQTKQNGSTRPVVVFGIASVPGRALGFHCLLEDGAQLARVPIHALAHRPSTPNLPLDVLQLWDCFSEEVHVTQFDYIKECAVRVCLRDHEWYSGRYMFTVDWCGDALSEGAGDIGHKSAHILRLDNGCFAAQPNNRIQWLDPAFVTKPFKDKPDYKTNTHIWKCEQGGKWVTSPGDELFYGVKRKK